MAFAAELLQALSASADDSHSVSACDAVSNPLQAGSRPAVKNSWQPTHIGAESRPPEMVENSNRAEKRVCNAKIKAELALALEFPSYREGLAAIHAGDLRPFD